MMSMFGMLDCTKNFKSGNVGADCCVCKVVDDENHRINECSRFKDYNLYLSPTKYDFHCLFRCKNNRCSDACVKFRKWQE